jgi:hypothetical protein
MTRELSVYLDGTHAVRTAMLTVRRVSILRSEERESSPLPGVD